MTGARGLLPALPRGGSGGAACGPSRPSTRGHGVGGADDIGPRQAPLGGTTTQDHRLARWAPSRPVVPRGAGRLAQRRARRRHGPEEDGAGWTRLNHHAWCAGDRVSARDPPPHWGVHHRRGSRGRGTISKVTDAVRRCRPGGGGAGLRVAFYPVIRLDAIRIKVRADGPPPATGCRGRPNPHRRGRGAWTAPEHVALRIWTPGDGEGASLKGAACAPIRPTGARPGRADRRGGAPA